MKLLSRKASGLASASRINDHKTWGSACEDTLALVCATFSLGVTTFLGDSTDCCWSSSTFRCRARVRRAFCILRPARSLFQLSRSSSSCKICPSSCRRISLPTSDVLRFASPCNFILANASFNCRDSRVRSVVLLSSSRLSAFSASFSRMSWAMCCSTKGLRPVVLSGTRVEALSREHTLSAKLSRVEVCSGEISTRCLTSSLGSSKTAAREARNPPWRDSERLCGDGPGHGTPTASTSVSGPGEPALDSTETESLPCMAANCNALLQQAC
mmetsp:Transcript_131865/g.299799  ORF Transcript_131865/g.299799 Transcript_131865/m.299799 type:complete len:271 (-) Transcript_131865:12-824(-)